MNTQFQPVYEPENTVFEEPVVRAETTHDLKRLNDEMGLTAMAKFGWLRAREIGNVLWPNNQSRNVAGARIARRWLKERLVIERKLPDGFGSAFVLSKKGAEFVDFETQYGEENDVVTGKKIGDHIEQLGDVWIPNHSWRHDLLANGFLTLALGHGAEVYSELELRRAAPNAKKVPDGLYRTDADAAKGVDFFAIELERSGKFSKSAKAVAKLVLDSQWHGFQIASKFVNQTVIVYEDPAKQHYGSVDRFIANHFLRVASQLRGMVPLNETAHLIGLPLVTKGGGVIGVSDAQHVQINCTPGQVIDKSVFGHQWSGFNGGTSYLRLFQDVDVGCPFELFLHKNGAGAAGQEKYQITIEHRYTEGSWGEVSDVIVKQNIQSGTLQAAQRFAVLELQKCQKYRDWAEQKIHKLAARAK